MQRHFGPLVVTRQQSTFLSTQGDGAGLGWGRSTCTLFRSGADDQGSEGVGVRIEGREDREGIHSLLPCLPRLCIVGTHQCGELWMGGWDC